MSKMFLLFVCILGAFATADGDERRQLIEWTEDHTNTAVDVGFYVAEKLTGVCGPVEDMCGILLEIGQDLVGATLLADEDTCTDSLTCDDSTSFDSWGSFWWDFGSWNFVSDCSMNANTVGCENISALMDVKHVECDGKCCCPDGYYYQDEMDFFVNMATQNWGKMERGCMKCAPAVPSVKHAQFDYGYMLKMKCTTTAPRVNVYRHPHTLARQCDNDLECFGYQVSKDTGFGQIVKSSSSYIDEECRASQDNILYVKDDGWTKCAKENQNCRCKGHVRFGTGRSWTGPMAIDGELKCSRSAFRSFVDYIDGVGNGRHNFECQCRNPDELTITRDRNGMECWNAGCWGDSGETCDWCGLHNGHPQICCNGRSDYSSNHPNCAGAQFASNIWGHQCVVRATGV